MNVKTKNNAKIIKNMMEKKIEQALHRIGIKWIEKVTPLVPVDTSNLQKSMKYKVDIEKKCVYVGTNVFYATFVELGTYKQTAQPYLKPSILDYKKDYQDEVRKVLGSDWKVYFDTSTIKY